MLKTNARTTKTSRTTSRPTTTKRAAPKARTLRVTPEIKAALMKLRRHATPDNIAWERENATDLAASGLSGARAFGREHLATAELYEALRAAR